MPRKGENIFKRKDGRWEARYKKGYEVTGKITYGFCYGKSYREAKEKVVNARILLQTQNKKSNEREPRRFAYYCDEWLSVRKAEAKESTYVKYSTTLERHIKPKLGEFLPTAFDSGKIEDFKRELLDKEGLSPKTVKDILLVLRSVMSYMAQQLPGSFTMPVFHFPKADPQERRVLSTVEQQRLTTYLLSELDDCRFGVLLALQTGLRLGELCALRWENISVHSRTIKVCETIQRLKNTDRDAGAKTKLQVGNPKTSSSYRIIPMSDSVAELCGKITRKEPTAYIMTGTEKPMDPRTLQYRLDKYTRECGLDGVHFHTLRHSFATRCIEADIELKSLSEILGHANTSVTLNQYVHSSLDLKLANLNKLTTLNL